MTEREIKETAEKAAEERLFCSLLCKFEYEPRHILPLKVSEGLFLSAIESGLGFDGYLVERFENVASLTALPPEAGEFAARKGLFDRLEVPPVETGSLQQVFAYLVGSGECAEYELGAPGSREIEFGACRCTDCDGNGFYAIRFAFDLSRDRSPVFIPYSSLVRLTFGTRALKRYGKYVR